MGYILLPIIVGISLFAAVFWFARLRQERQRYTETPDESVVPINLVDNDDAVVVAEGRGHLVFANEKARVWFGIDGGEPDLELMADIVQPTDTFLELFGKEGQASFRVGMRRIEASSHRIPKPDNPQMVVVMREIASAAYEKGALDPVQAMNVVSEITQTISASLKLDETLASILNSVGSVVKFDAGEITLWDESLRVLRPLGQAGDLNYFDKLQTTDGVYHLDDSFSGWIARYRQALLVADISLRPDVRPKILDYPFQSFIGMPLTVGDRFIGTLELASTARSAFDYEDMTLLQAVAGQAAIAIENARLYQSQSERVAELSGLQEIVTAMTSLTDPRQMYSQLTNRISGLMNVEMCGILLYDADQAMLVSQVPFYGVPDAIVNMYRIPLVEGSTARNIFEQREWWYTNNVRTDDMVRLMNLQNLAEAVGVRSTAMAPMVVGNRRFGVVQVSNKRDNSGFTENDLRLLVIFASQAAIVVENSRLYDKEQRRAEELGGLQQISQAIGALRDTEELYGQIHERIGQLMSVQICGILLHDDETQMLIGQLPIYGVNNDLAKYFQFALDEETSFAKVYNEKEFWIANDPRVDSIAREIGLDRLASMLGIKQIMFVAMIVGGRRLGVVQVANKVNGGEFNENDAHVLSIFTSQAAVIIENARLYREMRMRADEADGLRRIAEVASSNLPLDEIIKAVVGAVWDFMPCDVVALSLLDDRTGELSLRPEWTAGVESILTQPFSIDIYTPGFQSSVVITKKAFSTNDLRNDGRVLPVYRSIAERFNFNAVIQVPVVIRDRGIGELLVGNADRDFRESDIARAQNVAGQLAAAIERAQLYRTTDADLRARIQELDSLTRVSNELNLTIQLDRILEVIRQELQRTTNAETTVVMFHPSEEWKNPNEPEISQRLGAAKWDGLAPIERASIRQYTSIANYQGSPIAPQPPEAKSAIAAPVQYGDVTAGVIHVYSPEKEAFGKQAQEFVQTLANQAAIAVGNAIRYQQQLERSDLLRQRADQISQIFELGRMLRSEEKIEAVLEAVANGVVEAVGFNRVVINSVNSQQKKLIPTAQAGLPLKEFDKLKDTAPPIHQIESLFQVPYKISNSYFLPAEEEAIWHKDEMYLAEVDAPSAPSAERHGWDPRDLLLVPFRNPSGELVGVMSVDDPRNGKRPTMQVIEALEIFANQAAFAIENYQLVQAYQAEAEDTRRERDRLAQLHLVASEIQRANDVPTRLQVVADGIHAAGWRRVAITLRDHNLEPLETITSGFREDDAATFKANLLPGIVWLQRLNDPDLRNYRVGEAYYLRYSDQWVTENKLIAGADTNPLPTDPTKWHPLDTVYLPLYGLDRSRLIGIITMDSPVDGKPPTEASMRPIELFAVQAASAIENTRLYQETIRSAEQEARLNELMQAVSSTLDTNEIIESVAKGLQRMIAFTRMSVALLNEDRNHFDVLRVNIDLHGDVTVEPGASIDAQNSAVGIAYRESVARVYHLAEMDRLPGDLSDLKAWRESGERTSLVVPLVAGGRVLGALHMGSELAEAFGFEEQLPLVSRMANLTAIAIDNAQLFQQAITRERFSAALSRVGQSVNSMLDMASVLDTVCEESINILEVEGAYIWLVEKDALVGIAARGPGADTFSGTRLALDNREAVAAAVIREQRALYANDITKPGSRFKTRLDNASVHALLGVPLLREARPIGVIEFVETAPNDPFTDQDIQQASAFAIQAAVAIENARLYQETLGLQSFNDAIIQSIQQGIVVLGRDLHIRRVNAFMRETYGWTADAEGKALFDYRPNFKAFLSDAINKTLREGKPETKYNLVDTSEGKRFVRNFYLYPLLEGKTVSGIVVLVEDVTTRVSLEADVASRAQQLSVLTEVSGQMTATLEPGAVVQLVLDQLGRILEYNSVTLWLREGDNLVIRGARGYTDSESLIGIEAEIADSELFRAIASRGQVLNVPDVTKDARFPASADRPTRSWLGVSLVSRGNLAGVLVLEKAEVAYYTATMEQLALTFANQVAIALENAQLFQSTTRSAAENTRLYQETAARARALNQQAQRLGLLNRVSSALAQSLDMENIFEVALRETIELLNVDRGAAMLIDQERKQGRLIIEYPRGDKPPTEIVPLENNPFVEKIRQTLQPVVITDVQNHPEIDFARQMAESRNVLSMMIVPLAIGGQLIGTLSFDSSSEVREFTQEQIELAQTIAAQTAIAVQNANLYEQSVVRTRELETLFEATQTSSATLDLHEVYKNTALQMLFALQVDESLLWSWDNVENRLVLELHVNVGGESAATEAAGTTYDLADYPMRVDALVSRQAVTMYIDDPDLTAAEKALMQKRGSQSRIILPLVAREQAIGLIELESRTLHRIFSTSEIRLARTLASQATVAIENARLQTETASKLQELFFINELSTALASSIEQDQIFKIVRTQLPPLIKSQYLVLAMLEEDKQTISYPVALKNKKPFEVASHLLGDDEMSFVIKRRTPQLLAGNEMEEVLRNLNITLKVTKARSFLGVPLLAADEAVGTLVLADDKNPRAFGVDDQRILSTVGAQIAVAIQNSRLFARSRRFTAELEQAVRTRTDELRQERDRIEFLYRITTGLTASLDMATVLNRALEMMAQSVDADMGAILGMDMFSGNLVYRATLNIQHSEDDQTAPFNQDEGLPGWVIQSQQSIIVGDVQSDPRWLRVEDLQPEPHSAMVVLLEANDDVIGIVMLYSQQANHFSEEQLKLVTAAANQIANAMNNAELYGLIREQAERLSVMVRREQVDATKNAAIVDSIADGVMVADPNGDITQFNSAAERILGLPRRQVIGSHITTLAGLYAGGGSRWLEAIDRWTKDPTSHEPGQEVEVRLTTDEDKVINVVLSPVNMGDQFLGTVSVFRDITREIEVERMKSEFISNVSHELRTPMTSIKGYADLLLIGAAGQVNDQQQRFLSTIKTNADRLAVLVNGLLEISRIDRGQVKLNLTGVDLEEVIDTAVHHLQERVSSEKKEIEIVNAIPKDLPLIRADTDKIREVFTNLADNAFNYTYAGGMVTFAAEADTRWVTVKVSDTGIGIAKDKHDRIWNRFFRDQDQDLVKAASGTGLGLAIVREYVTMHDGEIWLESEVGKGSTFFVRLPVSTSTDTARPAVVSAA